MEELYGLEPWILMKEILLVWFYQNSKYMIKTILAKELITNLPQVRNLRELGKK
jgi:hypothetical protein